MGSGVSHLVGCFIRPRDGSSDGGIGVQFSEPLDEGLGHSFCYVRRPPLGSSPVMTPDKSDEFALFNGGKHGAVTVVAADETYLDAPNLVSSKDEKLNSQGVKSRSSSGDRLRVSSDKSKQIERTKIVSETSFKAISGASVSANTATPRSIISCEQFNSFSNVLYDRAAAFESTSSFSSIPLQPVPRGFSGPLSGPMDRGFMSGPLDRERGFMSGPLERGFMSGPLERVGYMSGPLDAYVDRTHFSAPLNGPYHYDGYFRRRKKSLFRFMRSVGDPMKRAFSRSAFSLVRTHRSVVSPVKNYMFSRGRNKEGVGEKDKREPSSRGADPVDASVDFSSSELDLRESDNLQWAQGKAGEDRVHVVLSEEHGWLFVGIYDGFNGPDAPDFLMSNLYPAVFEELKGLLWNPKEELSTEDSGEWKAVGANLGEEIYDEKRNCQRDETLGGDVIQMEKGRRRAGFRISSAGKNHRQSKLVESKNWAASPFKVERRQRVEDIPGLSHNSQSFNTSDTMRESDDENQWVSSGVRVESGVSQIWDKNAVYLAGERIQENLGQEKATPDAKAEGFGRGARLYVEHEGKVLQDWSNGQVDELESERSSSHQGFIEASSLSGKDHRLKRRPTTFVKLRHGHDRRKEQLRKYFQWRYDWDHNKCRRMEQEISNSKAAQGSYSSDKGKTVEHFSVLKALARALQTTENAYLDMADKVLLENPELALMGSCVLVMLMKDEDMYILNVGDSRAILAQHPKLEPHSLALGKGGWSGLHGNDSGARDSLLRLELERIIEETPMELEALEGPYENGIVEGGPTCGPSLLGALQLTTDHSTNIKEEVLRLKAEHPDDDTIENDRVKGKLKVTRAFGAGFLKQPKWNNALLEMFQINFIGTTPYITCSPALYHHRLGPQDQFLVLSSDGLYQYLSNEEVVSHVEWFMKKFPDGDPAQHLIEELLFRAAKKAGMEFHELLDIPHGDRRKYHDDVSVMVISA